MIMMTDEWSGMEWNENMLVESQFFFYIYCNFHLFNNATTFKIFAENEEKESRKSLSDYQITLMNI